jgi:hypothetical protein
MRQNRSGYVNKYRIYKSRQIKYSTAIYFLLYRLPILHHNRRGYQAPKESDPQKNFCPLWGPPELGPGDEDESEGSFVLTAQTKTIERDWYLRPIAPSISAILARSVPKFRILTSGFKE